MKHPLGLKTVEGHGFMTRTKTTLPATRHIRLDLVILTKVLASCSGNNNPVSPCHCTALRTRLKIPHSETLSTKNRKTPHSETLSTKNRVNCLRIEAGPQQ
jgi:hypothetical protein